MKLSTRSRLGDVACVINEFMASGRRKAIGSPVGAVALLLAVAACANSQAPAPTNVLGSQVQLAPATGRDVPNSLVFRAPDLDTRPAPKCFFIPDTIIDDGKESLFLDVSDQQKHNVANAVTNAFRRAIGRHQHVSPTAGPTCATLQLYLTGVTRTAPQDNGFEAYSNLLGSSDVSGRNLQASVNGTITVAGKFVAPDGGVLAGFVNKISTNAFNIPPDATPPQIAGLAADRMATDIAGQVDQEVAVQQRNHAQ